MKAKCYKCGKEIQMPSSLLGKVGEVFCGECLKTVDLIEFASRKKGYIAENKFDIT